MTGQTVFLTGGTGFVGRHVLAELLRRGHRVRCLVRPGAPHALPVGNTVEAIPGDILARDDCLRAAQDASAAIHLVGIIRESGGSTFQAVHVEGTRNVVEACRAAGVSRLVHMSAHGRLAESRAEYQRTKGAAERIITESGLRWTIFRPSLILGRDGEFLRAMIDLVRSCWRPVPVLGDGHYIVQPVDVEDVARLLVQSLDLPETEQKIYSLGGPAPVTFNEFLDTLSQVVCGRTRLKLHLPLVLARPLVGAAARILPRPPITPEQLIMLGEAAPVDISAAMRDFGWRSAPLETVLRKCLLEGSPNHAG
jgi:NADH dehydrogenase